VFITLGACAAMSGSITALAGNAVMKVMLLQFVAINNA
jgi:hypothetical protein